MQDLKIRNIVIVGGGTAGWMAASGLSKIFKDPEISFRLIESDEIATVGVGEATIPQIQYYNRLLDLDENDFIRKTNATFKLGIQFENWGRVGDSYIHPFLHYGQDMEGIHFHHFWLRYRRAGKAPPIDTYNLLALAARDQKFQRPDFSQPNSPLRQIAYAFHFDAGLYARYLRQLSEKQGVRRTEGKVVSVQQNSESGFVDSVTLDSGEVIAGDLFIDCTGFRGLLIEQTLGSGYEDWSHYLPCNRAVAATYQRDTAPLPYTRAVAKEAGWQWHIPLQSRTGSGYVFSSNFQGEDDAMESYKRDVEGPLLKDPYFLRFTTGMRKTPWNKNVVAIGLSSGFLEPLESTSIHLIQSSVARLMTNFPDKAFNQADIDYYNRRTRVEFEQIRDFLVLHYKATERDDTEFWNYCRTMDIPDTLKEKIAVFSENGRLYREDNEMFKEASWLAVFLGQNIMPKRYHPIADIISDQELDSRMNQLAQIIGNGARAMPTHQQFIDANCKADIA